MYREFENVNEMYPVVLNDLLSDGEIGRFGAIYLTIRPYVYKLRSLQQNLLALPGIDHNIFWMLQEFEDRIELRDPGYAWRFSKSYENRITTSGQLEYAQFDSFLHYQEYLDRKLNQLDYIILQLKKLKPRAVVGTVWDPMRELILYTNRALEYSEHNTYDYQRIPCTIAYTFTISGDKMLHFNVFMRANDLDRINPADMFMFGMLQKYVLSSADPQLKLGTYHHFVSSMAIRSYGGSHFDLWRKRIDHWPRHNLNLNDYYPPLPESWENLDRDWKLLLELTDNLRTWKFHQALQKVKKLSDPFWKDWFYTLFIGEYILKLSKDHNLVRTKKIESLEKELFDAFPEQEDSLLNVMLSCIQNEFQFHVAKQLCNFYARTQNWQLIEDLLARLPSRDLWPYVLIGSTKYLAAKSRDILLRQFHPRAYEMYETFYVLSPEDELKYTPPDILERRRMV